MKFFDNVLRSRALKRAEHLIEIGTLSDARQILEPLLRESPPHTDALRLRGFIEFGEGNLDAAQETFERVLAQSPDDVAAQEQLRQVHIKRAFSLAENDVGAAIPELRRALALNPDDAFVRYNLGSLLSESPETVEEALAEWGEAVRLRPNYVEPHFDLGQFYFHNARYDDALPHFEAILNVRRDWPAPYYLIAAVEAERGNLEQALTYLKTAAVINEGWARTAATDAHFAALRGNPEFDSLVQSGAMVPVGQMSRLMTMDDILRDMEDDEEAE